MTWHFNRTEVLLGGGARLIAAGFIVLWLVMLSGGTAFGAGAGDSRFEGKHYRGRGDVEYLRLLETARRMFEPDAELQNLAMLYEPKWNGLVEGPTWDAWWIQNSYGRCAVVRSP